MRRKEMEVTETHWMENILLKAQVCRIGLAGDEYPYIVPVNYGYKSGNLYFHSACEGKKLEMLAKNPKVCVQADIESLIEETNIPCNWSTKYKSVIAYGKAIVVNDPLEKEQALSLIVSHYKKDFAGNYPFQDLDKVCIVKVVFESITGKQSG